MATIEASTQALSLAYRRYANEHMDDFAAWSDVGAASPAEDGGLGAAPNYNLPALPIADAIGLYRKLCGGETKGTKKS